MEPVEGINLKELVGQCKIEYKIESAERERFNGMTIKEMLEEYRRKQNLEEQRLYNECIC